MAHLRWTFTDPTTGETWTVPLNPNTMSSPHPPRNIQAMATTGGRAIMTEAPVAPYEWTFGGEILTAEHYAKLKEWSEKKNQVVVSDHYGRRITLAFVHFSPEPKRALRRYWRNTYQMRTLVTVPPTAPTVSEVGI